MNGVIITFLAMIWITLLFGLSGINASIRALIRVIKIAAVTLYNKGLEDTAEDKQDEAQLGLFKSEAEDSQKANGRSNSSNHPNHGGIHQEVAQKGGG